MEVLKRDVQQLRDTLKLLSLDRRRLYEQSNAERERFSQDRSRLVACVTTLNGERVVVISSANLQSPRPNPQLQTCASG